MTATIAPMNGIAIQQMMPKTRLTIAVVLVVRTDEFISCSPALCAQLSAPELARHHKETSFPLSRE
jgi:hypothetical protein